jgi:hypothetical protein
MVEETENFPPCAICRVGDVPEWCSEAHTEAVQDLAWCLARYVQGDSATAVQAGWFIEDAEAMVSDLGEPPWAVTRGGGTEVALVDDDSCFEVNGVPFWFDVNGEYGTVPILAHKCEVCGRLFGDGDDVTLHVEDEHTPNV